MEAYGRFYARGELFEGYFKIANGILDFEGLKFELKSVKFLPPVKPEKIVCVGLNYIDHAEELNMEIPDEPVIFLKPPSSLVGHEDCVEIPELPEGLNRVDYEGELAFIIAKKCKNVSAEDFEDYILGYSCFNDVTARDIQKIDGQWTRAKSFDTFACLGPYAVKIDPSNLKIETRLNGKVVQSSTTSNLIFNVGSLLEFISEIMTLSRGDVIATGTPAGVGRVRRNDVVEVEIEGIGILRNKFV
jgi:2-keto-4-pentenoate hydratase/2-oxohepta-3-ene-1,7-dioic acid hydratase in catechol pathway